MSLITPVGFREALEERYLAYALSTITARSLPDVRDGLKPVHRRLIYAMYQLKLSPQSGFKKCARVVGDVMGKFHPHGDSAIYGALVRLAQDFSVRYPLIEGQGNFGNIDGDNPAAMRYTESRLSIFSEMLLLNIQEDTVDFRSTYDNDGEEPVVLPAAFPNILANGATGIAVGMATSIPPHNLGELCDVMLSILSGNALDLVSLFKGPDFPTGGWLHVTPEDLEKAYTTGRGVLRLRSHWHCEHPSPKSTHIVVTEIPYQVEKSSLIQKLADLWEDKKLPFLEGLRDESANDIRIVLTLCKGVNPSHAMEKLFRLSDLETRVSMNLNVLDANGVPQVLGLVEILTHYLAHQTEILQRKTRHHLTKSQQRLEIVDGYLIIYPEITEIIRILQEDENPTQTIAQRFSLTDRQVESILNLRLRSLQRLQYESLVQEGQALRIQIASDQELLSDKRLQKQRLIHDIHDLQNRFGAHTEIGRRRTRISHDIPDILPYEEEKISHEEVTFVCSKQQWIRLLKGRVGDLPYKPGDEARHILHGMRDQTVVLITQSGKSYALRLSKIPFHTRNQFGESLRKFCDLRDRDEIVQMFLYEAPSLWFLLSDHGRGFVTSSEHWLSQSRSGRDCLTLGDGEKMFGCFPITGDHVALVTEHRSFLILPVSDIPVMTRGRGSQLQKLPLGVRISDVRFFVGSEGLSWEGLEKPETYLAPWMDKRGSKGRLAPMGFPRNNRF